MSLGKRSVRLAGMRGMIAAKMMESLATTAQLSFHSDCDASALLACRDALRREARAGGIEDLVIWALLRSLREHPGLNGHVVDGHIETLETVNVAVAIALANGLVAPALFDAGSLGFDALAAARADLVERARAGRLSVGEMTGGTITLSNLGRSRVDAFTPILNVPQIAIVGLGRIRPAIVPGPGGQAVATHRLGLSLTVDHRAIDGAPAAAFLSGLCEAIEGLDRDRLG